MRTISSDELLAMTDATFMDNVDTIEIVKVIAHDGEVITTNRHVQYLHGFLHFNRPYNVPVYAEQVFPQDYIPTPGDHTASMERAVAVVHRHLNGDVPKWEIATNWVTCLDSHNNAAICDIEHFAAGIDVADLIELLNDPYVKQRRIEMKEVLASEEGPDLKSAEIERCNGDLITYLFERSQNHWWSNGVSQHMVLKNTKNDQLMQVMNVVGYTTEIDSVIYPMATAESFAEGMNYAYTYSTNASLGKKATMYNKSPISETETLNRLVQQMASQLENVHVGDCGSEVTESMVITKLTADAAIGMYHRLEDGTIELLDKENVQQYMGKVIYLRTIAGCQVEDPVGICSVCGGASVKNFVPNYNVGGASSCLLLGRNSQQILKTKHVDIISFNEADALGPDVRDFLDISPNGKEIRAKPNMANGTISFLAVSRRGKDKSTNAQFLQTVHAVKTLERAELESFGEVNRITITPNNGLDEEVHDVELKHGTSANFSLEILNYIRENPDKLTMHKSTRVRTAYTLDLSGFDITQPLFTMPFKHYDSLSLHHQLTTFFNSPEDKPAGDVLTDYNTFGSALAKLTKMTYPRLGVRMGILQMILLPFSLRDPAKGDYRMHRGPGPCHFGKMAHVRRARSLSVVTIASHQSDIYGHLYPLINDNMTPHVYDTHFV